MICRIDLKKLSLASEVQLSHSVLCVLRGCLVVQAVQHAARADFAFDVSFGCEPSIRRVR